MKSLCFSFKPPLFRLIVQLLDRLAGQKPQLSVIEITLLTAAVATCVSGPIVLDGKLAEFIAPSMAAISAAIGIGAEYTGKSRLQSIIINITFDM